MVIKTVMHFEIPADDPERLSKFYSKVFGWKFEKAPMPGMDYWLITTGPRRTSVGGGMYKKMNAQDGPRNFIAVDKLDPAIELFKSAGGKEIVGKQEVPQMGWSFIGRDPEGNAIALWETMSRRQVHKGKRAVHKAARKK